MRARIHGKKFRLLIYRHFIGRYRWPAFILAVVMLGLWYMRQSGVLAWPPLAASRTLLAAGCLSAGIWIFSLIGPALAYAQARQDHLRVQTPLFRLEIPYDLIQSTRPIDLRRVFSDKIRQRHANLLQPFQGLTPLAVDLRQLPIARFRLRIFFHQLMFAPDRQGVILFVKDWAALSQQIASRSSTWLTAQGASTRSAASDAANILRQEDHDEWDQR